MIYKKIMVMGLPGSGKSTFSIRLGRLLHLPVYHLDRYFFVANWQERNREEFLQIQRAFAAKDRWIIDGNGTRSLEIRFAEADLVLYFRFNRFLCLRQILKRRFRKDSSILDRAEGCRERIRWSLIRYLWGFHERVEGNLAELRKRYPKVVYCELRKRRDIEDFLEKIGKGRPLP